MSHRIRALFIVPVLLILLVPQFISKGWLVLPAPFAAATATAPAAYGFIRQANHAAAVPRHNATPPTPAAPVIEASKIPAAPAASPPAAVSQETVAGQLRVLDLLWKTVQQEYLYPDYNGLDWDDVYTQYRQRVEAGLSEEQFHLALREMIFSLGDDHSTFLSPAEVTAEEAQYAGSQNYVGVGFLLAPVPERDRATVLVTFAGGPAEQGGIQSRDSILAVDGGPILDEDGRLRPIIRGPEDTVVVLTLQTPGEEPRELALVRKKITGPIPLPYTVMKADHSKRVGYIMLVTLTDSTLDERVGQAIAEMTASGPLDGLVIDNRQNEGGADTVLRGILAYFMDGTLGHFISRAAERPLRVDAQDVNGSQTLPLVILVGENTYSYGEVMSGVLQDMGRAYLIGAPTEGNVETLRGYNLPDGSRAWLAHDSFRPLNQPQQDWELSGVLPDLLVEAAWDEYTLENDPVVLAALEHFNDQFAAE